MLQHMIKRYIIYIAMLLAAATIFLMVSCSGNGQTRQSAQSQDVTNRQQQLRIPVFDPDTAYAFIEAQLAFGPRVPNTEAHRQCASWLTATLQAYADTVYVQQAKVRAYNGTVLDIQNIIGVFQPEKKTRLLLCAHWDSRPYADWDPDPANHYTPIPGANDGGSGVGVLLEIARQLSMHHPNVGVDIVLFDAEDYGQHQSVTTPDNDSWALGSQYWAKNTHVPAYRAKYGILLDMVGASGATFLREGYSMLFAPTIVRKVWETARSAGFGHFFLERDGGFITDDHFYVNTITDIPTINIIHLDDSTPHGFFPYWHTLKDNMDVIDRATLMAVGQTVLTVVFRE